MSFGCNNKAIHVNESFKINFERVFRDFLMDPKRVELEFPTTLDRNERAYIHMVSNNYAISCKLLKQLINVVFWWKFLIKRDQPEWNRIENYA